MLFSQCATRPQPSSPAMVERSPGQLLNHSAQSLVLMFFLLLQDYLGGCIVFVATVTALTAASVSCRRHYEATTSPSASASPSPFETYAVTKSPSELRPSPSLVGLAINYTLLVPIYLNWVVKLLADMEMYAGSVERIAHYAQGQDADADADADVDADLDHEPSSNEDVSAEVDRSSQSDAGDKVYPGATTAAGDVDEDGDQQRNGGARGGGGGCGDRQGHENGSEAKADKLNAGNATGDGNHLNIHHPPATAGDKVEQVTTKTSVIKDKQLPLQQDDKDKKVVLPNEPARKLERCKFLGQFASLSWAFATHHWNSKIF